MRARGFTLLELIVALVLASAIVLSAHKLLVGIRRLQRQQSERAHVNATLRTAISILPLELGELNAADTASSDILAMSNGSITYKAMRTLDFVCAKPVGQADSGTVVLWGEPSFGMRQLNAERDSVLLLAQPAAPPPDDELWVRGNVQGLSLGTACPGHAPSVTLTLNGVRPLDGLQHITVGAPVRGFELVRVSAYRDASGVVWLGVRQFNKLSGWSTTQPVLGPLQAEGLRFEYFDASGSQTSTQGNVAGIGISVLGQSRVPVKALGRHVHLQDTLVAYVALRNNGH